MSDAIAPVAVGDLPTGRRPARRASDPGPHTDAAPATDRTLNLFLHAAERGAQVGITLVLRGGAVVGGTLVGTVTYCQALGDRFASGSSGMTTMDERFAEAFRSLVDDAVEVAQGDRRQPADEQSYERALGFVHLLDARFLAGGALHPAGRHGVLWRCRASEVVGWSLGELLPT